MDSVSVIPARASASEHGEQHPLGEVVRRGRIAGCRPDALVPLGDEVVVGQRLVGRVAPELAPHPLVQPLREGLGEAVRERLGHDRAVVVVGGLEPAHQRVDPVARGDRERADEVRRRPTGPRSRRRTGSAARRPSPSAGAARGSGRAPSSAPRPPRARCRRPAWRWPARSRRPRAPRSSPSSTIRASSAPGVVVQLAGVRAHHGVGQDRRERAPQLPGREERPPVDPVHELRRAGSARTCARRGTTAAAASSTSPAAGRFARAPRRATAASRGRPAPRARAAPSRTRRGCSRRTPRAGPGPAAPPPRPPRARHRPRGPPGASSPARS